MNYDKFRERMEKQLTMIESSIQLCELISMIANNNNNELPNCIPIPDTFLDEVIDATFEGLRGSKPSSIIPQPTFNQKLCILQ